MAPSLNLNNLFNKDDYSDITICFGSRKVKAHKMIVCSQSDHFKKMCGPGSAWAESGQDTIELHDDDETALEAMLCWLYNFDYTKTFKGGNRAIFHLNVLTVADKYLVPALRIKALEGFRNTVSMMDPNQLLPVLETVYADDYSEDVMSIVTQARDLRLHKLMTKPRFEELILNESSLGLELVQKLMAERIVLPPDVREVTIAKCANRHVNILEKGQTLSQCTHCNFKQARQSFPGWI